MNSFKVQPGFVVTVLRDGVMNKYLGSTACLLSDEEARANESILTLPDGSPLNLPVLPATEPPPLPEVAAPVVNLLVPAVPAEPSNTEHTN